MSAQELERRVATLEQEVDGEKPVTRHILEQVRLATDELAALRGRANRIEDRLNAVEARLGRLESELRALRRELPGMIAGVMREVLPERDARG